MDIIKLHNFEFLKNVEIIMASKFLKTSFTTSNLKARFEQLAVSEVFFLWIWINSTRSVSGSV